MANTKSAAKRARQTITRSLRNRRVLTLLKTETKRTNASLKMAPGGNKADLRKNYEKLVSELDKAVKRGVIHKNSASRRKSRLAVKLAALV